MIEPIKIYDDFYTNEELGYVFSESLINHFMTTYQPSCEWYQNMYSAYPCHETKIFTSDNLIYNFLLNKLNILLNKEIFKLTTFFRKIVKSDLTENSSVFKSMSPLRHVDKDCDFAGLIYLSNLSIMDGTKLFTVTGSSQFEPDLVIGAKPNRMIIYNGLISHEACFDKNNEVRIVQPFFIKLKK